MQRAHLIRKLVLDSHYVIDEHLVASAILARATLRGLIGEAVFRNDPGGAQSSRPGEQGRSFWPTRGRRLGDHGLHLGLM